AVLTYRDRYEALLKTSLTDEVTGVQNRAAFEETCRGWAKAPSSDQRPVTLAMIDVDHFKFLNDELGHLAGDEILCAVGRALQTHVRAGDGVFRYGGEEFVVLCHGLSHAEAMELAERLRIAVTHEVEKVNARRVTVSIGVASSEPGERDLRTLLDEADKRLYEAKRLGRDRVEGAR
ncbi:MAG: GGDEF domain-containing protein, partial [Hansschlegelia sp.]